MASPPLPAISGRRNLKFPRLFLLLLLPLISPNSLTFASPCRTTCGTLPIKYPFGIDDGCGAPQFRRMLNCSAADLFFLTPSGSYKLQSIDYTKKSLTIYDPAMSTCSILQPHHDFVMTSIQSIIIPPAPDSVFALLNCSIDSPILNHYKYLCFNFSGHSCDELYGACNAFRVFHLAANGSSPPPLPPPPCCFTGYDTVRMMSMNILDCSHYTTVLDSEGVKGVGPLDWDYGMKLSFSVADFGCDRCEESGGVCGFDTETEALLCLCSGSSNRTRDCAGGSIVSGGPNEASMALVEVLIFLLLSMFELTLSHYY